jgi:predicted acylesterase/phospholipase RssA
MQASVPVKRDLGIALSGGGHRASLFTLGALLYLVDSGANERVATISSVSGGSITSGFVAQECDFGTVKPREFYNVARKLASTITTRPVVSMSSWRVRVYSGVLVAVAVLIATIWFLSWPIDLPVWAVALLIMLWGVLFLLRGMGVASLLGRVFFVDQHGRPTFLGKTLNRTVDHVLCATDLTSAAPFYFFCGREWAAYSPLYKKARAGTLKLGTAVRASAALPGAIPPKLIWTRQLEWEAKRDQPNFPHRPRLLFLADGGVWNNLGTQYFERDGEKDSGLGGFVEMNVLVGKPIGKPSDDPGKLLIVDGSGGTKPIPAWQLLVPYWAEVRGLARAMGVLYTNTISPRIREIGVAKRAYCRWGDKFDRDWDIPKVAVSISFQDNPQAGRLYSNWKIPRTRHGEPFRDRAQAWDKYLKANPRLDRLDSISERDERASKCASEGTHLHIVAHTTAAALLLHGYIETMYTMHLVYGTRLVDPFPDEKRFNELLSAVRPASSQ